MSTPFHPQTDGATERLNKTCLGYLRSFADSSHENWPELLPVFEFAYNNSQNPSTGFAPYEILYGRCPRLPGEPVGEYAKQVPAAEEYVRHIHDMIKVCRDSILESQR